MQAEASGHYTEENRLSVYRFCFEIEFLRETENFYQLERDECMESYWTLEYIKKVTEGYLGPFGTVRATTHSGHTTLW